MLISLFTFQPFHWLSAWSSTFRRWTTRYLTAGSRSPVSGTASNTSTDGRSSSLASLSSVPWWPPSTTYRSTYSGFRLPRGPSSTPASNRKSCCRRNGSATLRPRSDGWSSSDCYNYNPFPVHVIDDLTCWQFYKQWSVAGVQGVVVIPNKLSCMVVRMYI